MRVVIIGARNRSESLDSPLVNKILDAVIEKYGKLMVVTKGCDRGVGKIIKSRRFDQKSENYPEFDMIELQLRHYISHELPRNEFLSDFNTLNAALTEIGDEFHLVCEDDMKGSMQDMLDRINREGKPVAIYKPSETENGYKHPSLYTKSTPVV